MVDRFLTSKIESRLFKGKAIVLMGPRQVGKTTLLKNLFNGNKDTLWLNGDEPDVQSLFTEITSSRIKAILGNKRILIIDEAQRINHIGLKLKIIFDSLPDVQIIATGSSSFELANSVNEPLTGRKWEYKMFPLSFGEMVEYHGLLEEKRLLKHRLVYGYYPDVINNYGQEIEVLKQLSESYLYKDVLSWELIHKPEKLIRLLQALALQLGSQVSYNELGQLAGLDSKTVEKYLNVLEQAYVIFRLTSFSRNLRNELKNSRKIYFYDNGIRNALLANFNLFETRTDIGALWENFLVSERIKKLNYSGEWVNSWFWRTKEQKEIDYIEESNGKITAFEFKWNPDIAVRAPKIFSNNYDADFRVINYGNFEEFLLPT
jgi:predicted AAA+ superfamily ATPase